MLGMYLTCNVKNKVHFMMGVSSSHAFRRQTGDRSERNGPGGTDELQRPQPTKEETTLDHGCHIPGLTVSTIPPLSS